MYRQSVRNEVSRQEMLNLRNQGLSNREVADSLDISYATVLKYLGKQDCGRHQTKKSKKVSLPVSMVTVIPPVKPADKAEDKINLPVINRHVTQSLQGCQCVYKVDSQLSYIELSDDNLGSISGMIEYADIPKIIKELQHLYNEKLNSK